jgi:membrane-associated protease RseP (regulator of RpoE activity)
MDIASEGSVTLLIVLAACGILGWGFYRAKPYGKLGILAWLQSVILMVPWLIFFGLSALGIYLNLASILFLFLASTGFYIFLGSRLRAAGQEQILRERAAARLKEAEQQDVMKTAESSLGLTAAVVPAIPADDLKVIQGLFGIDSFFATETIPYQEGVLFKGNLRGDAEAVYSRLSTHLQERLGDRYRLFLVENLDRRPVVIVLPALSDPKPTTLLQVLLAGLLAVATIATSFETAGLLLGFDLYQNLTRLRETFPIAIGLLAILATHEIGHRLLAARHQIRLSLPYFIPTWQIGSFGALNRFESWLPNRKVLFDIAFAGPAAGGLLSLLMLIVGLLLSSPESGLKVPSVFFQGSVLVGTLAKVILGAALLQPDVPVHPLVITGWLGLVITALNLMPAGQLDGGRVVQAIYGRKTAGWTTIATIVVLGILAFVNPLALYWAIVILFLQRDLERPSFNELSEPDDARAALGLLALFLMVATLIPLTPSLAGRLGIGG